MAQKRDVAQKSEFRVAGEYEYNRRSPVRWMLSHAWRHRIYFLGGFIGFLVGYSSFSYARLLIADAAEAIINNSDFGTIAWISFVTTAFLVLDGIGSLTGSLSIETLANRSERDARHELYISLLGKSQTFHDQQRVGDIMARATDDVRQLNFTISPGTLFLFDMVMGFAVPSFFLAVLSWQTLGSLILLRIPFAFLLAYIVSVRLYIKKLDPVVQEQRVQHGTVNAKLEETLSGIEIVKVAAQEVFERIKFGRNAKKYRDLFVEQGRIEAGYIPMLLFGIAFGLMFLDVIWLGLSVPDIIAAMGLMGILRFPVFISLFSLTLLQMGRASARRILELMEQESDIDENKDGHSATVEGGIVFENLSFSFGDQKILEDISFEVKPGETVAIVGQTGSGKTTLTALVGRSYDATKGRLLIDGVDVREWNLDSLRSQISKIEQDVFLFSRTVAENIAFGTPDATQEMIEQAAKEAQAHDFIIGFNEGYETKVGERGVTLSGGQRQRLALARAFLTNPRILIMDDSTSAIDSATEDKIQQAMRRAQEGRTTLLITHRLSQIRWADCIVVLENGRIVATGKHEELLKSSAHYRRIFARYEMALPKLTDPAAD